jgi:predicted phage-related endonuclease
MLVNVDRFVCARLDGCPDQNFDEREFAERCCDGCGLLECKTTSVFNADQWDDGELPYAALLQVHHAFAITGLSKAYVPALIGGQRFVISEVDRDDELIDLVINLEAEFWRRVVENDPPAMDGEESTSKLLGRLYEPDPDKIVELPDSVRETIAQREQASIAEKEAKKRKDQASNELKSLLGDAEVGTIAGYPVVTWKESIRDGYTVAPTTVRTLKIAKRKN